MSDAAIIALITAALGPAVVTLITWLRDRHRSQTGGRRDLAEASQHTAEGEATLVGATLNWAQALREDIRDLRGEVENLKVVVGNLEDENRRLRHHNELLTAQVIDLGGKPVPMP